MFHDLRRANATGLVAEGIDVKTAQARLGHSDRRMTLAIYAQATSDADRAAADRLAAAFPYRRREPSDGWRADTGDPSAGQPRTWTFIEFEVPEANATDFAEALSGALEPGPWYCDFRNDHETFVVFAGRVFRYPRGDHRARQEAERYARSVGVPEPQIDWRV